MGCCWRGNGGFAQCKPRWWAWFPVSHLPGCCLFLLLPASAQPVFDPLAAIRMSPEDGRERGGGPGASASNQPAHPLFHGKIAE